VRTREARRGNDAFGRHGRIGERDNAPSG
jgi:hypothetical protein